MKNPKYCQPLTVSEQQGQQHMEQQQPTKYALKFAVQKNGETREAEATFTENSGIFILLLLLWWLVSRLRKPKTTTQYNNSNFLSSITTRHSYEIKQPQPQKQLCEPVKMY